MTITFEKTTEEIDMNDKTPVITGNNEDKITLSLTENKNNIKIVSYIRKTRIRGDVEYFPKMDNTNPTDLSIIFNGVKDTIMTKLCYIR